MSGFSFLAEESAILVYAGVLGLEMGLVYDSFRILRRVWRCNFAVTAAMDFLFWCFVAYRTFSIMHTYSNGTLRWFAVFGAVVILCIYMKLFSKYFVGVSTFVLLRVRNVFIKGKKFLTNILKVAIIKVGKLFKKGDRHGKKSSISDEIS